LAGNGVPISSGIEQVMLSAASTQASMNSLCNNKSRGGYPETTNSVETARFAPLVAAASAKDAISVAFAAKSPTVGSACNNAMILANELPSSIEQTVVAIQAF
jgi:hypothetical protein